VVDGTFLDLTTFPLFPAMFTSRRVVKRRCANRVLILSIPAPVLAQLAGTYLRSDVPQQTPSLRMDPPSTQVLIEHAVQVPDQLR
jgi:hypothetical protein